MNLRGQSLRIFVFILMSCLSMEAFSAGRLLDEINVQDVGGQPRIAIKFIDSLQYVAHVPLDAGDELRVKLQSSSPELDIVTDFRRERLQWAPSKRVPLDEVTLESGAGNFLELVVLFTQSVQYKVVASADSRTLFVTLVDSPASAKQQDEWYVIQLLSSANTPEEMDLSDLGLDESIQPYVLTSDVKGQQTYRQRLGMFSSKAEADKVLAGLKSRFPDAWIAAASSQDLLVAQGGDVSRAPSSKQTITDPDFNVTDEPVDLSALTPQDASRVSELMEEARLAMVEKNYSRAVQLYESILTFPENPYSKRALEFLGLARERSNNFAQAKLIYDEYLAKYPEGEDADRIRQRIAGFLTAQDEQPRQELRKASEGAQTASRKDPKWDIFGGFSQFYQLDRLETETDSSTVQHDLVTDLDLIARYRKNDYEFAARFSGGYLYSFLRPGDPNDTRVSTMYFEALNGLKDHSLRIGRQTRNTGGVLGRYDGFLFGYRINEWAKLNFNTGTPVDSSTSGLSTDRFFYGANVDIGTLWDHWDFNIFAIEQKANGFTDRRAIGGEASYFDQSKTMFTLIDYDIFYDDLNTFLFLGTWTAPTRTLFNLSVDYRNSPLLTSSNAIQGQNVDVIGQLKNQFSSDQIFQLAEDRTPKSQTYIIGATHPINDTFQFNADLTVTRLEKTPASGGVGVTERTGLDFFYSTTLIASSLFKEGDTANMGLSYSDTTSSDTISWTTNFRYPVNQELRINPRFRINSRENLDKSEELIVRPELRVVYRLKRSLSLELEMGGEWSELDLIDGPSEQTLDYFVLFGYRADF